MKPPHVPPRHPPLVHGGQCPVWPYVAALLGAAILCVLTGAIAAIATT